MSDTTTTEGGGGTRLMARTTERSDYKSSSHVNQQLVIIVIIIITSHAMGPSFLTSEDLLELPGHDLLLVDVTVLLDRQDDGKFRRGEGVVSDTLDDIIEPDL